MTKLLPHLVWRKGIDGDTSGDRRWNDLTWRGRSRSRDPILNFITAYVDATLDDWHEAEGEPARPARYTEGKYWRVVYLPYMDNSDTPMDDDWLLKSEYPVRKLRQHLRLKVALLGLEAKAIERLETEALYINRG